jgi:hypothetical protein
MLLLGWRRYAAPAGDIGLRARYPVIASEAKQSKRRMDCFVAALLAMTAEDDHRGDMIRNP